MGVKVHYMLVHNDIRVDMPAYIYLLGIHDRQVAKGMFPPLVKKPGGWRKNIEALFMLLKGWGLVGGSLKKLKLANPNKDQLLRERQRNARMIRKPKRKIVIDAGLPRYEDA